MQGKIIKGIAGFYYVHAKGQGLFECKAKGIFRNQKIKPLVGDNVEIEILNKEKFLGNIIAILPRNNALIRPACANVDQAVIIFAASRPSPNYLLLSRFIVEMQVQQVETVICFNKSDLVTEEEMEEIRRPFEGSGCRVCSTSVYEERGIGELKALLAGKTTVLAGPSGVGKSSVTNLLTESEAMEVGGISEKMGRGKHTTRHAQLFALADGAFLLDTPGFTSLYNSLDEKELRHYFHEFKAYEGKCRFNGCIHVGEPACQVKEAVESGKISKIRYDSYVDIYRELKEKKKY